MLREHGLVRVVAADGQEYCFRPSFERIAALGYPHEIVGLYAALHGERAEVEARYVLASLCDQEDVVQLLGGMHIPDAPLIGPPAPVLHVAGEMPTSEQIVLARHLLQHGMVGTARPGRAGSGQYSTEFDVASFVAAARVHLGLSAADAGALSMTEFQILMETKFPELAEGAELTVADLDAAVAAEEERQREAQHG